MNYATVKKLLDAGFELKANQPLPYGYILPDDKVMTYMVNPQWVPAEAVRMPTLKELIEACGIAVGESIFRNLWIDKDGTWQADAYSTRGRGATPEEAVANLWLAIHTEPS